MFALTRLILVLICFACPLYSHLVVLLGPNCDFTWEELCAHVDARVVRGTENEMLDQIHSNSGLDCFILDSPVRDLDVFSENAFCAPICLNDTLERSLEALNDLNASLPTTDRDLPKITPEERGKFYDLMMKVDQIFQDHAIPYWGISGTLLGAVRHHGMIPWDDDLDIVIKYQNKGNFEGLRQVLNAQGLELFTYGVFWYKIYPIDGGEIIRENGRKYPWKYPFLDVYIINQVNDKICIVALNLPRGGLFGPKGDRPGWYLLPDEIEEPAEFVPFGPMFLPIPHHAHRILSREYGEDWKEIAYLQYDHFHEKRLKSIKVPIIDYSPPDFVLPQNKQ
ncbi:MAG: hypothetical protein K1000chlam2_01342 [Chlamydiae bacterium]|nr:hypothetical protein [Chlamydiota bacterium]